MSFKQFDNKCNAVLKLLHQIDAGFSSKNLTVYSATSAGLYYKCFPLISSPKTLYMFNIISRYSEWKTET
jgi:hypothetical protein